MALPVHTVGGIAHGRSPVNFMRRSFARVPAGAAGKFAAAVLLGAASVAGGATSVGWPDFLPSRERFAPDVAEVVERVWSAPTFTRTVDGPTATAPFDVLLAFVDAPDVTTAAARFLRIGKQEVRALGDDLYEANDHRGAEGRYRVLAREARRRVIVSWGRHRGALLGTIRGEALTVVDFAPHDGSVDQSLTTYVLVKDALAARMAQMLVPIFGRVADRRLTEGLALVARVAEWAVDHPDEFCEWLAREPFADDRRDRVLAAVGQCPSRAAGRGALTSLPAAAEGLVRVRDDPMDRGVDRREDDGAGLTGSREGAGPGRGGSRHPADAQARGAPAHRSHRAEPPLLLQRARRARARARCRPG
jgi:hypothetical protein